MSIKSIALVASTLVLSSAITNSIAATTTDYYLYSGTTGEIRVSHSLADLASGTGTTLGYTVATSRHGFTYDGNQFVMYDSVQGNLETYASINDLIAGNNVAYGQTFSGFDALTCHDACNLFRESDGRVESWTSAAEMLAGGPSLRQTISPLRGYDAMTFNDTNFIFYNQVDGSLLEAPLAGGFYVGVDTNDYHILGNAAVGFSGLASVTTFTPDPPTPTVPVPAAAWLFGSGLLGLIGVARRKVRS